MKDIHFFLGANSSAGFADFYDQLQSRETEELVILKGGPGCGKSTFLRAAAAAAEKKGYDVAYIHCSGDPDSLDGIALPERRIVIADGTAPHVLEAKYMAAQSRYIDFSPFYDAAALRAEREEIFGLCDTYRAAFAQSYHVLCALNALEEERRGIVYTAFDPERLRRRTSGIIARELGGKPRPGGAEHRVFLGGYTCRGYICRSDTAASLCPRIYELEDGSGLAAEMLERISAAAVRAGERVLSCQNPLRPEERSHLLIPGRGLAFFTSDGRSSCPGKPFRRIRIDAMAEKNLTAAQKTKLRFLRRMERSLEEEAEQSLAQAKAFHDRLEERYRPYIDFAAADAMTRRECAELFAEKDMPEVEKSSCK